MNTSQRSISLFELFKGFATIGLLGFGGVAVMARHVIVEQYQWLTEKEYATILGMGQVLPGANVVNASVVIGDRFQGPKGSIVCVLGIMVLPIMILLAFAMLYDKFGQLPAVSVALTGAGAAAAGMVLAEWVHTRVGLPHRLARRRVLMAGVAVLAYLVAASPLAGPEGLVPGTAAQFAVKTAAGSLVAFALVAPLVLDRPDTLHRVLGSTAMVTLGRWSYGLFIWHLAALAMVFPVLGTFPFTGRMPAVLVLTLIFGFAIAAVSYALVESPCRDALRHWEKRQHAPTGAGTEPGELIDAEADSIAP